MTAYRLLDLHIDVPRQRVRRDGQPLEVAGLSFQLLAYLLAQGTRVVGFDELMQAVWAPAVVNEETVTQRVKLLRQALGDDARRPRYLRSVRGRGYQLAEVPLALDVAMAADAQADPAAAVSSSPPPALAPVVSPPAPTPVRGRRWMSAAATAVVLIAAVAGLWLWQRPRVAAPSPLLARAAYYAGIGQADNNERAIALYRQALAQSPDSAAVLAGLSRALSARTCLYNGDAAQAQEAAVIARRLLQRDEGDARAWAALGYAQDCLGDMGQAVAGYEQAVRLDPSDDNSRASLAYLYQEQGRLAEALHGNFSLREPARVRFRDVQVARELELLGFIAAAERRHRANFELFPDNVFANIAWPHFLLAQGRMEEAAAALKQARARGTPHPGLSRLQGELELARGDRAAAAAQFADAARLRPHQSLPATLAGLYAATPPAPQWLDARVQRLQGEAVGWSDAALELALLEQHRQHPQAALAALRKAVAAGFRDRAWLATTPLLAALRRDPGFAELVTAIDGDLARQRARVEQAAWFPRDLQ